LGCYSQNVIRLLLVKERLNYNKTTLGAYNKIHDKPPPLLVQKNDPKKFLSDSVNADPEVSTIKLFTSNTSISYNVTSTQIEYLLARL
jgi:hypothetical protein